jgi:excisionase family DNA binding protein
MPNEDKLKNDDQLQEWFTPAEAARYLRLSRQSIYNYMEQGLLPYYELKSGRGRRLRRADLDSLLEPPPARSASEGETRSSD